MESSWRQSPPKMRGNYLVTISVGKGDREVRCGYWHGEEWFNTFFHWATGHPPLAVLAWDFLPAPYLEKP